MPWPPAGAARRAAIACSKPPLTAGDPRQGFHRSRELVNAAEFETVAGRKLDSLTFAEIAGSERGAFDRTFRPRLMIDSRQMDLTTELLDRACLHPCSSVRCHVRNDFIRRESWPWRAAPSRPRR